MNEGESCTDAAVREVQEETGFDPAPLMKNSPVRCQSNLNMCHIKLEPLSAQLSCLLPSVPLTSTFPLFFFSLTHSPENRTCN